MRRFAEQMGWAADRGGFAIDAAVDERLGFLKKTYTHLTVQILAVGALTWTFIQNDELIAKFAGFFSGGSMGMIIYLACFFGLSLVTRKMMAGGKPLSIQYLAAGMWVVFLSILVSPLCYIAAEITGGYGIITEAFILTLCVFGSLTAYALTTKKDFSFLRGAIWIGSVSLIGVAFLLMFMGGSGGIWYSILWVVLLAAWTLYDTSQILHHRATDQYVAASVDLLLDFVYMFMHLLMILLNSRDYELVRVLDAGRHRAHQPSDKLLLVASVRHSSAAANGRVRRVCPRDSRKRGARALAGACPASGAAGCSIGITWTGS